jgi:hypothetical protein
MTSTASSDIPAAPAAPLHTTAPSSVTPLPAASLPRAAASVLRTGRWHRPLLWLAAAMALLAAVALVARVVDPREITGVNAWDKPLKFALSTLIYSVTWSWLVGRLTRGRRVASAAGTSMVVLFAIEIAIIAGAATLGTTSHFNVSTPLNAAMWTVMAVSISVLWVASLVVSVQLFRNPLGDRARTLAVRSGAIIALVGLALGFLMTGPTGGQLADFRGIAGAHTVGIPDGGPGLPVLGWSTIAGDLRIPHFVGMHALQAIQLALIIVELLARRVPALRSSGLRLALVRIGAATYAAVLALVTVQALRGQSIVHPDGATVAAGIGIAVVSAGAVLVAVGITRRATPTT